MIAAVLMHSLAMVGAGVCGVGLAWAICELIERRRARQWDRKK